MISSRPALHTTVSVEPETRGDAAAEGIIGLSTALPEQVESTAAAAGGGGLPDFLIIFTFCFCLTIVLTLVGNVTLATIIMKTPKIRQNTSNLFLFSLLTSRASIGLFVVPARLAVIFSTLNLGSVFCRLCHFFAKGSSAACVLSVVAIAISKYYGFVMKGKDVQWSYKGSVFVIVFMWLGAFTYASRMLFLYDMIPNALPGGGYVYICLEVPELLYLTQYFVPLDFICLFALPACIITFSHVGVIHSLRKRQNERKYKHKKEKKLENGVKPGSEEKTAEQLEEEQELMDIEYEKDTVKAVRMLVVIVLLFILCNGPNYVFSMYVRFWPGGTTAVPGFSLMYLLTAFLLSDSNAWLNIIVFIVYRRDLRRALLVRCGCREDDQFSLQTAIARGTTGFHGTEKINTEEAAPNPIMAMDF